MHRLLYVVSTEDKSVVGTAACCVYIFFHLHGSSLLLVVVLVESMAYLFFLLGQKLQVVLCEENFRGISNMSFKISLARPALVFKENAIVALYAD